MVKDITFDERIDLMFDRFKDGDAPDHSPMYLADTDCANCDHNWHKGESCSKCPCEEFRLRDR